MKEILHDDPAATISYVTGNTLIMIFFMTLGICILIYIKYSPTKRAAAAPWLAWSLILCATSRAISTLCVWYGFLYTLNGIFSIITGLESIVTVILLIPVIKRMIPLKDLEGLSQDIDDAQEKLQILENLKKDNA